MKTPGASADSQLACRSDRVADTTSEGTCSWVRALTRTYQISKATWLSAWESTSLSIAYHLDFSNTKSGSGGLKFRVAVSLLIFMIWPSALS